VRPELPIALAGTPQAPYAAVDNSAPLQPARCLFISWGKTVQTSGATSKSQCWSSPPQTGTAEITSGDKTMLLTENQSSYISLGEVHRLANSRSIPLEISEVQLGNYLGEDHTGHNNVNE
jgi:mannose-1-phosphate guanylyltransferase/mannose-6-phosphate isomerase